jgi:hypothetical protein
MQEYSSVSVYISEHAKLTDKLNALATDGWAVVSIVSTGSEVVAYLSRAKSSGATVTPTPVAHVTPVPTPASEQNGWASATSSAPANTTTAAKTPSVPADWYKDPAGRYEFRYWDGTKWTEHVSRGGVRYSDPPTP